MDWVPHSDPFIHPDRVESFDCEDTDSFRRVLPKAGSPVCQALQYHDAVGTSWTSVAVAKPRTTTLSTDSQWEEWISSAISTSNSTPKVLRDGFCILFIPRAKDADVQGEDASGFTELPIKLERWKKVAEAFCLPGLFYKAASRRLLSVISVQMTCRISGPKERVWMQTATTKPADERGFALAATHIESRSFTYAVMVGCSSHQIKRVERLVKNGGESVKHPLLMLGVCAELHLDRLQALVRDLSAKYKDLIDELNKSIETKKIRLETIQKVQSMRDESRRVEEEISTTKSQLSRACTSGVKTLLDRYKVAAEGSQSPSSPAPSTEASLSPTVGNQTPPSTAAGQTASIPVPPEAMELTNLFDERFQDILSRLEGLAARCQIIVEGISSSSDAMRSELARQEASTSARNTAYGTAFALMAAVYLPTTAVATILAMPIFGWTNDWRDWRYNPTKSSSDGSADSGAVDQSDQPVVSGYVWIWIIFSAGLSLITCIIFYVCICRKLHRRDRVNVVGQCEKGMARDEVDWKAAD